MKSALVVIAAVLAASGQSVYSGSSTSSGTAAWGATTSSGGVICGSPNYNCAVTDNQAHLPTATVNLGNGWAGHSGGGVGANIVAIDHSLALPGTSGAKILRLTDGVNVANYARTFSGGGHNVISAPQANGKRYVAVAGAGGVPCMFEFDEAAMANAVEGQVCAGCSRKLWCTVSASASYGGTQNETYHYGSVQFPRAASAPAYSFYAAHQDAGGTSPKLRRYLIVVKSTGLPPDSSGTQTLAYEIDPTFPEYDPDNANCLNGALAAGGYTYGNDYISVDDQRFVLQTSPQDSSPWAVAIRVDTNPPQCRAVNAQAMQISCGWNTPGCWKDLNYNPDAQARFQRTINAATRDASGNVTVSFTATHTFPAGNGSTANVEGCGSAANIDVRGAPITAVTGSTLTYTSPITNQGNTFNGLNCTFSFGRGMHNTDLDRSGTFAQVGYNTTGLGGAAAAYIQTWNVNTDDFDACPVGQDCSGHSAPGYQLQYLPGFGPTRTSGYRTLGNPVGSFVKCTDMGVSPPIQQHFSANVANSNNSQWLESTYNAPVSTPHGPYEGELILHSCADGKIRRFAHNFSDGSPASNSIFASSVAQISSDGNYAVVATKFQAFWDQFAEATLSGLTLTVDGTAKTITRASGDFGVDGIVIGDLVKLNGMANPANNYGFEVTAVSGAGLTVRDPTAQLLSEGPTASAAVERHVSMAARGFGDKAGNNTCDPTQDPDASGTQWCRSDVLLVKLQ